MKLKDLIPQEKLAEILDIDTRVLAKWREEGLTYHRIGKKVYFIESELMEFIREHVKNN